MSIAKTYSAQLTGLETEIVTVEVDISHGLHAFSVVGLGDRSIDEARDRISAAIKNSGYVSPKQKNQKVIISLAPADLRKEGPSFDLPMAVAYLSAAGEIEFDASRKLILGELSLEGRVRRISGLLPILCRAPALGFTEAFVPKANESEASLAEGMTIFGVGTLGEIVDHVSNKKKLEPVRAGGLVRVTGDALHDVADNASQMLDMSAIRGNESAKRGLEIAAGGAHNVILYGPPGTGKTMLAQSFHSILPPLTYKQSVEVTGIHSAARILDKTLISRPPFRAPHHTASFSSMVGGGSFPRPGEVTLAHRGVLFLDEFPQFDRAVIEALRQPLEDRLITISRSRGSLTFPAQCILIASMNPCPCGQGEDRGCTCSAHILESYRRRISGPIMDRLDLWLQVSAVDYGKLAAPAGSAERSDQIRARVTSARQRQSDRFAARGLAISFNSEMNAQDIERCVFMEENARSLLASSAEKLGFSGRAFHRLIKVAQTIADLAEKEAVAKEHVLEALQYRQKMI